MQCPFLEEVLVRYCEAYPVKKMIPSSSSDKLSLCLSEKHNDCLEYKAIAKANKGGDMEMKKYKARGEHRYFPPGFWKICRIYACNACPYEPICIAASRTERKVSFIEGFALVEKFFYHPKHIWIETRKDGTIRLGIDDLAHKLLGKVTGIDLPEKGIRIHKESPLFGLKCGERNVRLCSPIDGRIRYTNEKLKDDVSLLNEDPYMRWVITMEPSNLQNSLKNLLFGEEAKVWFEGDVDRLRYRIERDIGVTVVDGGTLIRTTDKLDKEEWESLIKDFLLV